MWIKVKPQEPINSAQLITSLMLPQNNLQSIMFSFCKEEELNVIYLINQNTIKNYEPASLLNIKNIEIWQQLEASN